jgi:Na+/melibiose symporter-like transporter
LVRQALDGLRFVARHSVLRASLGCTTTINFFTFIAQALLILYASRTLGLSDAVIGLALGIGAAGGIVGAVVAPRIARVIGIGRTIMVGAVLFPRHRHRGGRQRHT